jgi:hypothetical protein
MALSRGEEAEASGARDQSGKKEGVISDLIVRDGFLVFSRQARESWVGRTDGCKPYDRR